MRLIDVDKLLETLQDLEPHCDNKQYENGMLKMLRYYMPQIINDEPTAYSVDGVVEELEERKALHERLVDYETKNGTVTEKYQHIKAIDVLNDAIEIVKQGGIVKKVVEQMDEEEFCYCHYHNDTYEYFDCLDYMECEECPYYYVDED